MPPSCYTALGVLLEHKFSSSERNAVHARQACSGVWTKAELRAWQGDSVQKCTLDLKENAAVDTSSTSGSDTIHTQTVQ